MPLNTTTCNILLCWFQTNSTQEKQIPRDILKFSKCPSYPPYFYATQIIIPILSSMISANRDKGQGFSFVGSSFLILV